MKTTIAGGRNRETDEAGHSRRRCCIAVTMDATGNPGTRFGREEGEGARTGAAAFAASGLSPASA